MSVSNIRNRHWFLSWLYNDTQTETAIRNMVSDFSDDTMADIQDMISDGSGWV